MEELIVKSITWAGVAGLFIWKVLAPLVKHWVSKMNGGNGSLWDKVDKMKKNHLQEVNRRLDKHSEMIRGVQENLGDLRDRVSRIEEKLSK